MPKFTDDGICTITDYEVSSSNTNITNPGSNFLSDPTDFSSDSTFK